MLIGYASSQPDGTQVAAYAAAHTERLGFLVAHRPGFVAPTLAARQFTTLDQFTGGRIAVHIITGGHDAEQRRDGDYLSKDERYARTDEYLDIVKLAWTVGRAVQLPRHVLPGRGPLLRRQVGRSSRGSGCTSAARPRRPTGSAASTPTPTPCGASRWRRPRSRSTRSTRPPSSGRPTPTRPASRVSFRPILGPTEELAWERAHRILETTKENIAAFRAQWGAEVAGASAATTRRTSARSGCWPPPPRASCTTGRCGPPLAAATGAGGNSTALVGTPETVAQALLDYVDIGVTTILIRGYDPYDDAIDYGRYLLPLVREEVARRDAERAAAQQPPRPPRRRRCRHERGASGSSSSAPSATASGGPGSPYLWLDEDIPGRRQRERQLVHRAGPAGRGGQVRPDLHRRQPVHHRRLPAALPQPARAA